LSKTVSEKPFWLKPPWQVLFDLVKLYKIRPWDIDLKNVLSSFVTEMFNRGYIDFAASGTALFSSSIILRLQSEHIMKLQEPPPPPQVKPVEILPPPLQLPFRYEFTSTTLDHLITALEDVVKHESEHRVFKPVKVEVPPPDFFKEYDRFFVEIESKIDDFYNNLKTMTRGKIIPFAEIVKGKVRIEIIRTFLLLLFLASKQYIQLLQDEEFGDLYIDLSKEPDRDVRPLTV
jgi:segregation and condensation protein A